MDLHSNSTFRILHRHLHTSYFHNENWKKPIPKRSEYFIRYSDSSLPPELISLFTDQLPSQTNRQSLPNLTRNDLFDQAFSDPHSPWYMPRDTITDCDPDRLYAKSSIKKLYSSLPEDVPFDQIQPPRHQSFTPVIDAPENSPLLDHDSACHLRATFLFKLSPNPTVSVWELDNWCPFDTLTRFEFFEILKTLDHEKYLMPSH